LRQALTLAYGQVGRVRKRRILYLVGRTRIHLDRVEQLGNFLELEVVLNIAEPAESGVREATALMQRLEITPNQLIESAYIDLLLHTMLR
jgi:predicted adenylyl cyclase CyaB